MKNKNRTLSSFEIFLIVFSFVFSVGLTFSSFSVPLGITTWWFFSSYHSYVSAIYEQTNRFYSFDDLSFFFNSKYNLSTNEYFLFDASKEIETTGKRFFVTGQDCCRKHGINCPTTHPEYHYLQCGINDRFGVVYELCNLPLTYDSFDERHLFVRPCNYYFVFMTKITALEQNSFIWIRSSFQKAKSLYGYLPSSESEECCFSLKNKDFVVGELIFDGIPSSSSDGYKKESFDCFMQYLEGIKDRILDSFISAYYK